jgi:enamine deaminase RidA (YjgF/YER057c/UK114 family)
MAQQDHATGASSRWPFTPMRRIGDTVYVGLQVPMPAGAAGQGDAGGPADTIETQTHAVFEALEARLREGGGSMADLTKLHTYYLYAGEGRAVTDYWERMTAARLDHLADPGPAATALRVQGVSPGQGLIAVDGIGELGTDKQRIMPAHAWDWSIPTPFSQGWRVGHRIYVGGQLSADRQGRTIAADQVIEQTRNTLEYIRHVLQDGGAQWSDVVSLKIAHRWSADAAASRELARSILDEIARILPGDKPALTMLGVDLLYEGLVLEIDATALVPPASAGMQAVRPPGSEAWHDLAAQYPAGWRCGNELWLAAHCAPAQTTLQAQFGVALERLDATLHQGGGSRADLVKINVFYTSGDGPAQTEAAATLSAMLQAWLGNARTVVSMVRLAGFMQPGQQVQVDGLAILGQA